MPNSELLALETALAEMLTAVIPITETCTLPVEQCFGRITARAIQSPLNMPGFDNSAMDGYAVCVAQITHAPSPIAGNAFAGQPFQGEWPAGSCIRIMTGAPLPTGCDAVIIQEEARVKDGEVHFLTQPIVGQNIRHCGEDIHINENVIPAGQRLNAANLPLLASLGISHAEVIRKLRVAIFSTGDELKSPGQPLAAGQIYDSNRLAVRLMLEQLGCEVFDYGIIRDDPEALRQVFTQADQQTDVVISSAGVSVGEKDYTRCLPEQLGKVIFWRLAMKPGKPFAFGRLRHSWFCGLPGNPVSALITFYQLVQPLLAKLSGLQGSFQPNRLQVRAGQNFKKYPGRLEFQRGILQSGHDGQPEVISTGSQGSHIFSSFSRGNCFIVLERERGNVAEGEWVEVELFNHSLGYYGYAATS